MTNIMAKTIPTSCFLSCILLSLLIAEPDLVAGKAAPSFWSPTSSFGILRESNNDIHSKLLISMRGGSTEEMVDESEEVEEEDDEIDEEDEEEDEDEDEETSEKLPKIASMEPVRLIISTNWGNSIIDQTVELTPARTRDVASLKKSLSKQLPGRPPIVALDLVFEGRILEDDTLVDELFEDDEDEEEDEDDEDEVEEGNEPTRRLTLNLVPPVDPKFATELGPKLVYSSEEDDDYTGETADPDAPTADELIDAYYMNQVAMSRNAQLLADPNMESNAFMRMELQEQARQLRDQLQAETPVEVWEKCMEVPDPSTAGNSQEEWKGQRYRSTKGGVSRQLKTVIQTNLNVVRRSTALRKKNMLYFLFPTVSV